MDKVGTGHLDVEQIGVVGLVVVVVVEVVVGVARLIVAVVVVEEGAVVADSMNPDFHLSLVDLYTDILYYEQSHCLLVIHRF